MKAFNSKSSQTPNTFSKRNAFAVTMLTMGLSLLPISEASAVIADHSGCAVTYQWINTGSDGGSIYFNFSCTSPATPNCYAGGVNGYVSATNNKYMLGVLLAHQMSGKRLNVRTDTTGVGPSSWGACNIVAIHPVG